MQSGSSPSGKQADRQLDLSGLLLPARRPIRAPKPAFDASHIHCGDGAVATRHNAFVFLPLNADQRGLTYLGAKHVEAFDFSIDHTMKLAKAITWMTLGVLLISFGAFVKLALRPLMQEGFWPALAGVLICFGVLLIAAGVAAQIARTPKRNRVTEVSGDKVARLLAAYPGPITLRAVPTGWGMMAFGVVLITISGVMTFLGLQTGDKEAVYAFTPGLDGLLALAFSVRTLFREALQLDQNGFQLLSRKQYLWAEVYDFHNSGSGVRFNVVEPRSTAIAEMSGRPSSRSDALVDNYGLEAEELADLMESWQSVALDDPRDKQPFAPAISQESFRTSID
jgi:hypothetical protein